MSRTIFVARLPERFPLGENNSDDKILEAGNVEEAGVLKVLNVVFFLLCAIEDRFVDSCRTVADTVEGENNQGTV